MSIRRSSLLRNALAEGFGIREVLRDGLLRVYSGSQPATGDTAPTGTLLCEFTLAAGVYTTPVKATAAIQFAGVAGQVTEITVGGMAFDLLGGVDLTCTSANQIAAAVAAQINAVQNPLNITAVAVNDTVTLSAPFWLGAGANGLAVVVTSGGGCTNTINGASADTFLNGVSAVNGLNFQFPAVAGVLSKEATLWQGSAQNSGNAGWFRFAAGGSDFTGAGVSFDGAIATSGGDITMGSVAMDAGAIQTVSQFTITLAA